MGSAAVSFYMLLDAGSPNVMATVPPVGAQPASIAAPVKPVPPERAVVLSSTPHVAAEMTAIGAQSGAIALTPVVTDRATIVDETTAIALQVAPIVADIASVRTDVATIGSNVTGVVTNVLSSRRNRRLSRDRESRGCKANSHCGAQGREL